MCSRWHGSLVLQHAPKLLLCWKHRENLLWHMRCVSYRTTRYSFEHFMMKIVHVFICDCWARLCASLTYFKAFLFMTVLDKISYIVVTWALMHLKSPATRFFKIQFFVQIDNNGNIKASRHCHFVKGMVHCEIWDRCILGFVDLVYCMAAYRGTNHVIHWTCINWTSKFKGCINNIEVKVNGLIFHMIISRLWIRRHVHVVPQSQPCHLCQPHTRLLRVLLSSA